MNMAKAYEDYLVGIRAGWTVEASLDYACECWSVSREGLIEYIKVWEV